MKKRLYHVITRYLILIILLISYYFINKYTGFGIPCIFYEITGFKCPGCGITRCLFSLIQFKFNDAFNYNPLVFIYLPFIVAYFIYNDYIYIKDKKDKILVKIPKLITYILVVITILFGILRNII